MKVRGFVTFHARDKRKLHRDEFEILDILSILTLLEISNNKNNYIL